MYTIPKNPQQLIKVLNQIKAEHNCTTKEARKILRNNLTK